MPEPVAAVRGLHQSAALERPPVGRLVDEQLGGRDAGPVGGVGQHPELVAPRRHEMIIALAHPVGRPHLALDVQVARRGLVDEGLGEEAVALDERRRAPAPPTPRCGSRRGGPRPRPPARATRPRSPRGRRPSGSPRCATSKSWAVEHHLARTVMVDGGDGRCHQDRATARASRSTTVSSRADPIPRRWWSGCTKNSVAAVCWLSSSGISGRGHPDDPTGLDGSPHRLGPVVYAGWSRLTYAVVHGMHSANSRSARAAAEASHIACNIGSAPSAERVDLDDVHVRTLGVGTLGAPGNFGSRPGPLIIFTGCPDGDDDAV